MSGTGGGRPGSGSLFGLDESDVRREIRRVKEDEEYMKRRRGTAQVDVTNLELRLKKIEKKNNDIPLSLDEWVEQNIAAQEFKENVETHISVMTNLSEYEQKGLVRLIMISFRDSSGL